jgi:hypothetical protein
MEGYMQTNNSMQATEHRIKRLENLLAAGDRLIAYAQDIAPTEVPNFAAWRTAVQRILKESTDDR